MTKFFSSQFLKKGLRWVTHKDGADETTKPERQLAISQAVLQKLCTIFTASEQQHECQTAKSPKRCLALSLKKEQQIPKASIKLAAVYQLGLENQSLTSGNVLCTGLITVILDPRQQFCETEAQPNEMITLGSKGTSC